MKSRSKNEKNEKHGDKKPGVKLYKFGKLINCT